MKIKSAKHMPGKAAITPEFAEELKELFKKHEWPGHPVGFTPAADAIDGDCNPGPRICPDGSLARQEWDRCPNGDLILRNYCP